MPGDASRANRKKNHKIQLLMPVPRAAIRRNEKSQGDGGGTVHYQNQEKRGAGHTESKSARIYIRVTPHERDLLRKKAKRAGLSVSEYVRNAAIYGDSPITAIDTKPLMKLNWELIKQGTNLNQLMKFINTYGEKAYDSDEVSRVLNKEIDVFDKVGEALISLRREADAHHVIINLEAPEYSEDD